MQLSLRRWQKSQTSQGFWPVKQLPGVIVMNGWCAESRQHKWHIQAYSKGGHMGSWAKQIWGEDWQLDSAHVRAVRQLDKPYPTRRAALDALEVALTEKQPGALGEVITG